MSNIDQQPPAGGEVPSDPSQAKGEIKTDVAPDAPIGPLDAPEWLLTELKRVRAENAQRRTENKKLKDEIESEKRRKLEEAGKYQELYEQTKSDLSVRELEAQQSVAYKAAFQAVLDNRIKLIPEASRALVPTDYDPIKLSEWLDANWKLLASPKFPNLDPGAGSSSTGASGGGGAALSPEAQEVARRLKIAPERAAQLFKGK